MEIAAWISALVTTAGVWIAVFQLRGSRLESFADRRPYVLCKYRISVTPGKPDGVYLDISNVGETPASDIKLSFEDGAVWNWVNSSKFPFSDSGAGISVLAPGETLSFFIGNLSPNSGLQALKSESIKVHLTYKAYGSGKRRKTLNDEIRVTLMDYKYQSKK